MAKAWTAARRRKFAATMKAKRAQRTDVVGKPGRKPKPGGATKDAIIYLRQARKAIFAGGARSLTRPELYTLLALDALEGEG